MVNVGDRVRDKVTGFVGIVIGKTTWLNGCNRLGVQPTVLHEGKPIDAVWFDEPQLELVEAEAVSPGPRSTGGPISAPKQKSNPK